MKKQQTLTKRLIVILCLLLAFVFCMTACKSAGSNSGTDSGSNSSSGGGEIKADIPVITLTIDKKPVEKMHETRDYVLEDKAPVPEIKNVLRCKPEVKCTGPDGKEIKVNKSYVFKLNGLGAYTFVYTAKSPEGVSAKEVTYKITYTDPGVIVSEKPKANLWSKQQIGWSFELPKFDDLVDVVYFMEDKVTEDYVGTVKATFTDKDGNKSEIANPESTQNFDKCGTIDLAYSIADKEMPAQEVGSCKFAIEIDDYLNKPETLTVSDSKGYTSELTVETDKENCAEGKDYYLKFKTASVWGAWEWAEDNPLLQSFNHSKDSYLVINCFNPTDKDLYMYPGITDNGAYDGAFDDDLDTTYSDKVWKRGMEGIPHGDFQIALSREEFKGLKLFDFTIGMLDWSVDYDTGTITKPETGGHCSDTVLVKGIELISASDERVKHIDNALFSADSVIEQIKPVNKDASVTVEEGGKSIRMTNTKEKDVKFDLLTDPVFAAAVDSFVNTQTRGRKILAFDVENISTEDEKTYAKANLDAYCNRVLHFSLDDEDNHVIRYSLKAGEKVTINLDAVMLTKLYNHGSDFKNNDTSISSYTYSVESVPIDHIYIGANGLCDVRIDNFRIIDIADAVNA